MKKKKTERKASSADKRARDHRELGQELDLFSFHEIAPGAPFWHPKGMIIFRELEKFARKLNDADGYDEINTPILAKKDLFEKSGHWEHYRDNMFWFKNPRDDNEVLVIKPMNCPESTYVYNSTVRSYRDFPIRLAEIGRLHRNELSGTLGGLFRVRQITMDDAHIYVRPDQAEEEIIQVLKTIANFYKMFGFDAAYQFATKPDGALGTKEEWDIAEHALKSALERSKIKFSVAKGEGAFYGPKIEVHIKDSQGRDWQMGTVQLDLVMLPDKFNLGYINEEVNTYAESILKQMKEKGIRTQTDLRNETIGKKIREAEMQKVPYILVIGEKEAEAKKVAVRERGNGDLGQKTIEEFIKIAK